MILCVMIYNINYEYKYKVKTDRAENIYDKCWPAYESVQSLRMCPAKTNVDTAQKAQINQHQV